MCGNYYRLLHLSKVTDTVLCWLLVLLHTDSAPLMVYCTYINEWQWFGTLAKAYDIVLRFIFIVFGLFDFHKADRWIVFDWVDFIYAMSKLIYFVAKFFGERQQFLTAASLEFKKTLLYQITELLHLLKWWWVSAAFCSCPITEWWQTVANRCLIT